MRVVIVGGGNVGTFMAAELATAEHDVVLVEVDPDRVRQMQAIGEPSGVQWLVADGCEVTELAGADVDRDVTRAQEEELGVVVGVVDHEFAAVVALAVAGFDEHLAGRLGQRALVRDGDAEHGEPVCEGDAGGTAYRCR